jgi:glycosyltransferase involved in cell wall biosynthesis
MIGDVLESAQNQSLNPEMYEVVVIDQSTNDKTKKLLEEYPGFKYIKLDSEGISISRNEGIKHSTGKIVVFVDDDILFGESYLANILDFFNNSELKPDVIGGKTLLKCLAPKPEWIEGPLLGVLAYSDYGDTPCKYDMHPKHVPYTCNIAVKRECIEKINGFLTIISDIDNRLHPNEDVLFANKLRNCGYNLIYCPSMLAYHKIPAARLTYEYYRNRYFSQGRSDAYVYYLLKMFSVKEIPINVLFHLTRVFVGIILQFFKIKPSKRYYQKLRVYYNAGYVRSLIRILLKRDIRQNIV